MPEWRIYYGDGSTCDSDQATVSGSVPVLGVVAIAQVGAPRIIHLWDWYWYHEGACQWYGADLTGLLDQILHCRADVGVVLQGRTVPKERYDEALKAATYDPEFPPDGQRHLTRPEHSHD
jgi:hypothetical protein